MSAITDLAASVDALKTAVTAAVTALGAAKGNDAAVAQAATDVKAQADALTAATPTA